MVHQPSATLIALGVKTIETRPSPPNGPMRPEGVRGYPGLTIEPGERIAIVAGKAWHPHGAWRGGGWLCRGSNVDGRPRLMAPGTHDGFDWSERMPAPWELPLGAVVCTMVVTDALPMGHTGEGGAIRTIDIDFDGTLWIVEPQTDEEYEAEIEADHREITDQLPFGDYSPGRWGWLLEAIHPCEPIPVRGRQGVFELPPEVSEVLS